MPGNQLGEGMGLQHRNVASLKCGRWLGQCVVSEVVSDRMTCGSLLQKLSDILLLQ